MLVISDRPEAETHPAAIDIEAQRDGGDGACNDQQGIAQRPKT